MLNISFAKPIVKQLHHKLTLATSLNNFRLYQIAQSLIWFDEKVAVAEIATRFNMTPQGIYEWMNKRIIKCATEQGKFSGDTYIEFPTHLLEQYTGKVILVEDARPTTAIGSLRNLLR